MIIEISEEETKYMYSFVQRIVNEIGPRMPCSSQELEAAEVMKSELEKTCDNVMTERFTCNPRAFLGWIRLDLLFVIASISCYFVAQIFSDFFWLFIFALISFILMYLALLIIWEEFFNYKEFIDPLFRKKSSQNVVGRIKAKEEPKKIIIFSSHIDSALQFNLLKLLRWGFLLIAFGGILIMLLWFFVTFLNLIIMMIGFISLKEMFVDLAVWLLIIGSPCFVLLYFFVPSGEKGNIVPGAVDNLSSCSVLLAIGRYLKIHRNVIPNDTEIRLIAFGCEEAGLRGAYRYCADHLEELKKYDAIVVNMDGLETPNGFHVIEYEPTTRTKHSEEVVQKLLKAAESLGVKIKKFGAGKLEKTLGRLSGGSDAAAFSKAGVKAAFLNSADWKTRSTYYHQSTDTPDKIKNGTLETALQICISFLINESKPNKY